MVPPRPYKLEVCVISPEQAVQAQTRGADRIELCVRLDTEGMTPDPALVAEVLELVHVPVRVMVRETEAGFEADEQVLDRMIRSVQALKKFPVDGFVFGVLRDHRLDRDAMRMLLHHAAPFPVTVHKAIDQSSDIAGDIQWLNGFFQVDTLLTSGGALTAMGGVEKMKWMKTVFRGEIMGAGKITPEAIPGLHGQLGLQWYHGRALL